MTNPLFWLVLSLLFVTVSLTIVLVVAIPTLRELSRAARSAEKLFDTLRHEFPPTLQAIRLTGLEISDLTEDVSEGVQSAGQVVKQVDQSLSGVRQQAQRMQYSTRSVVVGIKAAWRAFTRSPKSTAQRRSADRLSTARPNTTVDRAASNRAAYDNDRDAYEDDSYDDDAYDDTYNDAYADGVYDEDASDDVADEIDSDANEPSSDTSAGTTRFNTRPITREPGLASDFSDSRTQVSGLSKPSARHVDPRSLRANQASPSTAASDAASRQPSGDGADL